MAAMVERDVVTELGIRVGTRINGACEQGRHYLCFSELAKP